jgi:hypothetical protein
VEKRLEVESEADFQQSEAITGSIIPVKWGKRKRSERYGSER